MTDGLQALDSFGQQPVVIRHPHLKPVVLLSARGMGAHACTLKPGKGDAGLLKKVRLVCVCAWVCVFVCVFVYCVCVCACVCVCVCMCVCVCVCVCVCLCVCVCVCVCTL